MAFLNFLFGTVFYLAIINQRHQKRLSRGQLLPNDTHELAQYWTCSWLVVMSTFFAIHCMKLVPISIFGIFCNLKPMLVMFLGLCAAQETLSCSKLVFILLSFLGSGLIVDPQFFAGCFRRLLGIRPGDPNFDSAAHGDSGRLANSKS